MLSIRFAIFAAIGAVALWGLFSLLENLRKPELLRSAKAVIVKGCDPIESDEAIHLCPQLFCQKSLLDARVVPLKSGFEITVDQRAEAAQLVGGIARVGTGGEQQHFACILENGKVAAAKAVQAEQLNELSAQPGAWSFSDEAE